MRNWACLIYTYWLDFAGARSYLARRSRKAPPPDPAIGQSALQQMRIAEQQLAFSRQQYEDQKRMLDELMPMQKRLTEGQIAMNELQMRQALEAEQHYKDKFQPLETRFAEDAARAGSQAEQDVAAGRAGADVQRQIDLQREASARSMASMGVNPASGRFQGADRAAQIEGAASRAGAMNIAAEAERLRGDQMRLAAAQFGRGISGASLAASGATTGTAGAAGALGQAGLGMHAGMGQQFMSGMGQASHGYGNAASTFLGLHGARLAQHGANQSSRGKLFEALGGIAGAALGGGFGEALGKRLFGASDRRAKKNVVRIGTTKDGVPYYSFSYVWGEPSRGVMADEVPPDMRIKINGVWHVDYSKVHL